MEKVQVRQGDLLIERVSEIPGPAKQRKVLEDGVLAHGEITGHKHQLQSEGGCATLLRNNEDQMYITTSGEFSVVHDEHAEIRLDAGTYHVIRQREYDQDAINEERIAAD